MRILPLVVLALAACAPPEQTALTDTKTYVQQNLDALVTSSTALCAAAPAPTATGWNPTSNTAAVTAMRAEWVKARDAWEHVEGSLAVLFPEYDASTDERYDGFLENATDTNLFDDQVVTGVHAIERILYADGIADDVRRFEEGLGSKYVAAAFPANETQARDFKEKLCARLVNDVTQMRADYKPLAIDTASAFRGVIGSMQEQIEKIENAATGAEESRYARRTLGDMRRNLEGAEKTYEAFRPWLQAKGQTKLDADIQAGLARMKVAYDAVPGDALPLPPTTWSSVNPSDADRQTPFGTLFTLIETETQHTGTSLVASMLKAAEVLGIPPLPEN
jgi:iron uptake system component EfeO